MRFLFALALLLGLSAGAQAQTTIYTSTLPGTDSGNAGISWRDVLTITGSGLGQVRVTFHTPGGTSTVVDHASIGISTGTGTATTATPVELTFAGGHGFTYGTTAASFVSDWVNLSGFTGSNKLVVIMDLNATTGGGDYSVNTSSTNATGTFYSASATWNVASPAGGTSAGAYGFVALVETQSGGGGGSTCGKTLVLHGAGC